MAWGPDHPSPHYNTTQETPLPPGKRKERELVLGVSIPKYRYIGYYPDIENIDINCKVSI